MNQKDRNLIADAVRKQFIPFAFICSCDGEHPDCYQTKNHDAGAMAQAKTVQRISNFIRHGWIEESD